MRPSVMSVEEEEEEEVVAVEGEEEEVVAVEDVVHLRLRAMVYKDF